MKVSIIVPCVGRHFKHIFELLTAFTQQTILPNEIVISVSEVRDEVKEQISKVSQTVWPFKVKILEHTEKIYAGGNRNYACQKAKGDLLILQDADDIPHQQRIEIIKYIFEHYHVDFLMHGYTTVQPFPHYSINDLAIHAYTTFKEINIDSFHQGNICITKEVFKKIKWPEHNRRGQDQGFNRQVFQQFNNNLTLTAKLLFYRHHLSSWK